MMPAIRSTLSTLLLTALLVSCAMGFSFTTLHDLTKRQGCEIASSSVALNMGLFGGIAKAFQNEEFKAQDQRVRASHILIKGDDIDLVLGKVKDLLGELNERVQDEPDNLQRVFAEMARRESQCPSAAQGGDLGLFAPGKMVKEFDIVLFPDNDDEGPSPPAGSVIGPVVTEFGCHVILVTQREENRDQVEEKLARIDPDARV